MSRRKVRLTRRQFEECVGRLADRSIERYPECAELLALAGAHEDRARELRAAACALREKAWALHAARAKAAAEAGGAAQKSGPDRA